MFWRNASILFLRPFQKFPFAFAALGFFVALSQMNFVWPHWTVGFLLALPILSVAAFRQSWRIRTGRFSRRRYFEGALSGLLSLHFLTRLHGDTWETSFLIWLMVPYFLFLIYAEARITYIVLLFGALALLHFWDVNAVMVLGVLAVSSGAALLFRWQEKRKRKGVSARLQLYEREADALSVGSAGHEAELRFEDKKDVHLADMMRNREATFHDFLQILQRTLQPHTCAVYLYEPLEENFLLKDYITSSDRFSDERIQPTEGIFSAVLRGETVKMVSPSGQLRGLEYYSRPALVCSVVAVPLISEKVIKGVVLVDRLEAKPFSSEALKLIEQVAEQFIRAIDQTEMLHAYFHLKEELASFYAASNALSRSLRMEDVMQTLLEYTRKLAQFDLGLVVLHEPTAQTNRVAAEMGENETGWRGETFACAAEQGLVSWVIQNQTPLAYSDFRARDGRTPLFNKRWRVSNIYESVFIMPMQVKGDPLGAIVFLARQNNAFSKNIRKMMEVIVMQAAICIKNARMVGELEKLATTDGLTGLTNHRTFQERLANELLRGGRHPAPTSLLLLDIDFFKKFNDEYGHPVGDFVLREMGNVLSQTVRKIDLVSRYGGEEFAVILVNTNATGAAHMADRIVQTVAKSKFVHEGVSLKVTVSVGAATFPGDANSREALIECADKALYEAKHVGRNRAAIYREALSKHSKVHLENRVIQAAEAEVRQASVGSTN